MIKCDKERSFAVLVLNIIEYLGLILRENLIEIYIIFGIW